MALLEIPYLEALKHYGGPLPDYGAPSLNRYLEVHPSSTRRRLYGPISVPIRGLIRPN